MNTQMIRKIASSKKAPATIGASAAVGVLIWIQSTVSDIHQEIAAVRERIVRIETRLGIEYVKK